MTEPLRISRSLLEHYLRTNGLGVLLLDQGTPADSELIVANLRGIQRIDDLDIGFRLGLCAAAEDDLARAAAIGRQYDILRDRSAQTARDELVAAANRKLGYAGITPEQWEATR